MADGTAKPIKDVKVRDKVKATDPRTGKSGKQSVVRLHSNTDTELTDVTVTVRPAVGDAKTGGRTAVLHTTKHHPFWDKTARAWVDAANLTVGHELRTADGRLARVTAVRNFAGRQNMRDLTVAHVHTYYVVAGNTPVLVHNCGDADFIERDGVRLYGPFHRLQSSTQTPEVAQKMVESGELWGKAPNVGLIDTPAAQAHLGPLPKGKAGVEFYTPVRPGPPYPGQARWLAGNEGVREEDGFAKIPIIVTRNTQ